MYTFSEHSLEQLNTCSGRLQEIVREAIKIIDFTVIIGYRNPEQQEEAFEAKKSKLHWPNSAHNKFPSLAVDLAPINKGKIDWTDVKAFAYLAGIMKTIAFQQGVDLIWGGDFNRDNVMNNDGFNDLPHFEIRG